MTEAQKLIMQETKKAEQRKKQEQEKRLKQDFEYVLDSFGIEYEKELKLDGANYRLDYRVKNTNIGIALQGGIWSGGRHIMSNGYIEDRTKYNLAVLEGWQVFELTNEHVNAMLKYNKIGSRTREITKMVLEYCKKNQGGE